MEFLIRSVKEKDAAAILEYLEKISGESENITFGPGEFDMTLEKERAFLKSIIDSENAVMYIAEIDGEIAGQLHYKGGAKNRTRHDGDFGISVQKKYWNNGIGKALINEMIKWANTSKYCEKINLLVRDDNHKAIALYRKSGFKVEGLKKRDLKINGEFVDALYMGLEINREK